MLFNSTSFIFNFLTVTLALYYLLRFSKKSAVVNWGLIFASLVFYATGNALDTILICTSVITNFGFTQAFKKVNDSARRKLLFLAISANLLVLIYFKYFVFLIRQFQAIGFDLNSLAKPSHLPLAISFFTFQQIAFLVYQYRHKDEAVKFSTYFTSVVFFPHLIAGPLVEYKNLIPQFLKVRSGSSLRNSFYLAIFIFILGLAKKLLLADSLQFLVNSVFEQSPVAIQNLSFFTTLTGVLAYTFQLYFDFSGYSDMAIGLALFFGIKLPQNFNSPYKSKDLVEFWRRWHISLSQFLRDYLYIPLGGSRKGPIRRYINLLITMALGGLWHGAGWNFLIWGVWHGAGLCFNHIMSHSAQSKTTHNKIKNVLTGLFTFIFVVIGWVFFRAKDLKSAEEILLRLFSPQRNDVSILTEMTNVIVNNIASLSILGLAALLAFACPNSNEIKNFVRYHLLKAIRNSLQSQIIVWTLMATAGVFFLLCLIRMTSPQVFIYYQF